MDTPSGIAPTRSTNSVWVKVGAIFFIAFLGFIFFLMASRRERHKVYDEVPAGGSAPGKPGQVIVH
jgi:hypothetical protein